ncbi:FAD:protein FMN transferase [Alteromonas sp. a30]|uniref:FAD:protein FMN transferase n=1 Tax=Alteromonas sp. a30 TaxID=2730917 RepID=UPI002280C8F8|nr:FAD:protein FMN transferase [Alteromonas sp. a30]
MGTTYSISYYPTNSEMSDDEVTSDVHQQIKQRLLEVNQVASTYIPDSELSLFNQSLGDEPVALSEDLNTLVAESINLAELTGGALDVTVGPLVNLWGFGPDKVPNKTPSPEEITQARARSGISKLHLQNGKLSKETPLLYVDLSTIAKGFGVDEVAEVLEQNGIHHYLVEIGGEIRVKGTKAHAEPWRVAIEKPISTVQTVQRILQPGNNGVATSGDYRNFFERDGKRYSHIIDPKTGQPINHRLVSVTVLHPSCMIADGLSTSFMVLGHEKAMALANKENIPALFIEKLPDGRFKETFSEAMQRYISRN